jgi:hypothetical protein
MHPHIELREGAALIWRNWSAGISKDPRSDSAASAWLQRVREDDPRSCCGRPATALTGMSGTRSLPLPIAGTSRPSSVTTANRPLRASRSRRPRRPRLLKTASATMAAASSEELGSARCRRPPGRSDRHLAEVRLLDRAENILKQCDLGEGALLIAARQPLRLVLVLKLSGARSHSRAAPIC